MTVHRAFLLGVLLGVIVVSLLWHDATTSARLDRLERYVAAISEQMLVKQ